MPDKKYLSAQEVQKEFGPSRHTLLKWESEGAIAPARVGNGQRRYDRDQIATLLKQGIKPPPIATISPNGNKPRPDFREYGVSGLNRFGGSIFDEQLRELRGRAGRIKYSEMRKNSPVVAAIFFGLVNALKQPSIRAKPASDSTPDQKAALWLETNLNDMSFSWMDTLDLILQPLFEQGFTLLELVYKRRLGDTPPPYTQSPSRSNYNDGKVGWRKFAPRPAESLADGSEWIYDNHGGIQGINQQPNILGGMVMPLVNYAAFRDIEGQEDTKGIYSVPIEKLLHFRTTLHPANNPEGMSLLRPMYLAYHFATNLQEIEGIGAERDLAGIPVIYLGEGTTLSGVDSDYEESKSLVVNLRNDEQTGVVIPHPKMGMAGEGRGVLLELLSTGGRRNWDVGSIIERYEKRMALSCLAQFIMLGMSQVGSYALSRHQGDLFVLAASAFLQSVADVINRHAIPRLFALNAFPGITGYPELVFSPVGIPDLEAVADFVNKLVEREVLTPDPELERHLRQLGGLPAQEITVSTSKPEEDTERGVEETALLVRRLSMAIQPLQELLVLSEGDAQAMLKPLVEDLKRALGVAGATDGEGFEEAQAEAEGQMRRAIGEGSKIENEATQYVALMKHWRGFRDFTSVKKNEIDKFNPWHDERGRFTGPGGSGGAAVGQGSGGGGGSKPDTKPGDGSGAASGGESGGSADTDPDTWGGRLTGKEEDAVLTYAGSRYQEINSGLRSGKLSKEDEATVAHLDSALKKSALKEDTVLYENQKLYRAASIPEVNAAIQSGNPVGLKFTDKGFVSTTADRSVAGNFQRGEGSRLFVINAPKGTHAGNLGSMPHGLKAEKEFLLPRNTSFKVTKVEKVKEKYQYRDFKGKIKTGTKTVEYIHMDIDSPLTKAKINKDLTPQGQKALSLTEGLEDDIRQEWATLITEVSNGGNIKAALARYEQRAMSLIAEGMDAAWTIAQDSPIGEAEREAIDEAIASQQAYLENFMKELMGELGEASDEDKGGMLAGSLARAVMYAGAIWGLYNLAKLFKAPPEALWEFRGPNDERTCQGCSEEVKKGPRPAKEVRLPGSLQCLSRCRHEVVRVR